MSHAETAAPTPQHSPFVTTLLKIVGGSAVVVGGAALVVGSPLVVGAAAVTGVVALGAGYATSGTATVTDAQPRGKDDKTDNSPPDTSGLKTRMDAAMAALTIFNRVTGKAVAPARRTLNHVLAKAQEPTATKDDVERANKTIDAVVKDVTTPIKDGILSDQERAVWSQYGTAAALTTLPTLLPGTADLAKRLKAGAASLKNAATKLSAARYVVAKGVPKVLDTGTDQPEIAARAVALRDLMLKAEGAGRTIGDALAEAKNLSDVRLKATTLASNVATLVAARNAVPSTDAELMSKAASLDAQLSGVPAVRKETSGVALELQNIKARSADELVTIIGDAVRIATNVQDALQHFVEFEAADAADQTNGGRVLATWEAIEQLFVQLDDARKAGKNTADDREVTNDVRKSRGFLTATSLRDAVVEAVELYKRMSKEVADAGLRLTPPDGAKPAKVAVAAAGKPAYTYLLGATAITNWGDYDDQMQKLIGEIRAGTVSLSDTFELSFGSYKNHSQGARRTKVYLDTAEKGGGTTIRGYFDWVRAGDVVTVTPIAVTEEHGSHDRVLVGSF